MTNILPTSGEIQTVADQGEAKAALENQRDFISNMPGGAPESVLTISGGVVFPLARNGGGQYSIATEASAATDDVDRIAITSMQNGQMLFIRANDTTETVVLKHLSVGTEGRLSLKGAVDYSLTTDALWVLLSLRDDIWYEVLRT